MAAEYKVNPFKLVSKGEYFDMLMRVIGHLPAKVVIQRLFSDYNKDFLISDPWNQSMSQLTSEFLNYLRLKRVHQGMFLMDL
jgi:radical SAM superfamily enzyme